MAMKLSTADISRFREEAERLKNRVKKATEKADEVIGVVVDAAEVQIAAFGAGLLQGKTGGVDLWGVPVELLGGAGLHVLAFMGVGGSKATHLHNFGNGLLAAYMSSLGRDVGKKWKARSGGDTTSASGELPSGGSTRSLPTGKRLSEKDLESILQTA